MMPFDLLPIGGSSLIVGSLFVKKEKLSKIMLWIGQLMSITTILLALSLVRP